MRVKVIGSNMAEISLTNCIILISYETPVAAHLAGEGFFRTSKKFSATTTKHINKWLEGVVVEAKERSQEFFDDLLIIRKP